MSRGETDRTVAHSFVVGTVASEAQSLKRHRSMSAPDRHIAATGHSAGHAVKPPHAWMVKTAEKYITYQLVHVDADHPRRG